MKQVWQATRVLKCAGALRLARGGRGAAALVFTFLALAALGMTMGCSSSTTTHLAYAVGGLTGVAVERISTSGVTKTVIGSPFVAGASPSSILVHPSKRFLFVANQSEDTISLFKIDATSGALTAAAMFCSSLIRRRMTSTSTQSAQLGRYQR